MDLRAHRLTVRFFRFLARHAHASPPAAYLSIFCYILILWALVQSPLFFKMNDLAKAAPALRTQVARLKQQYNGDQPTLAKKLQEAYAQHGVNPAWGCLHSLIDLAVVAVFFLAFRAYAPQLALDGARFFWTADLLNPDLGVLALWGLMGLVRLASLPGVAGDSIRVVVSRALLSLAMVGALAWLTQWPAWILIFGLSLWLWSLSIHALTSRLPGKRA
jgi:membrane protein insertase Oxa1/YidC/SpoIIIJ